jgi:hypothetical protein
MCSFIVGLTLDFGFEMELEVDVAVWHSDIDPVLLEERFQDFEARSLYLVLLSDVVSLAFKAQLCIKD